MLITSVACVKCAVRFKGSKINFKFWNFQHVSCGIFKMLIFLLALFILLSGKVFCEMVAPGGKVVCQAVHTHPV